MNYKNKSILLLHHYEPEWQESMERMGIHPDEYTQNIIHFLATEGAYIDHVIITRFDEHKLDPIFHGQLLHFMGQAGVSSEIQTFPYGLEKECFFKDDFKRLIDSSKGENQVICIDDWMLNLGNARHISLAGAFEGECVQDAQDMLNHLYGSSWAKHDALVVGTGVSYSGSMEDACAVHEFIEALDEDDQDKVEELKESSQMKIEDALYLLMNPYYNDLFEDADIEIPVIERKKPHLALVKPLCTKNHSRLTRKLSQHEHAPN